MNKRELIEDTIRMMNEIWEIVGNDVTYNEAKNLRKDVKRQLQIVKEIKDDDIKISLCPNCNCMTKTKSNGKCWKCNGDKK